MTLPTVPLVYLRRLATASSIAYALLVVTGGAVRLTGSGLGCPDWPTCSGHLITTALSYHRSIEYGNRLVTVIVSVLSIAVFLATFRLPCPRRDLRLLASGLMLGLIAQIVLGGLVVLFKLNPYLVCLHFLLTLVVLADALVLRHRTIVGDGPTRPALGREMTVCTKLGVAALGLLITLGTVATGSGPHAGDASQHAKRIHIAFHDAAELHSDVALFTIGIVLALLFGLRAVGAPGSIQVKARILLEVLAVQGILGFTQYALHDNAVVVEFHLAGATVVWVSAVRLLLSLRAPLEPHLPSADPARQTMAVSP